jgi:hypothetical protein
VQIVAGVLHVDKGGIEARQPDDLDDLRVGDPADMGAEREPAFAQYPFYPILFHAPPPVGRNHLGIGRRAFARTIARSYSRDTAEPRLKSTRLTFIDEPLCVLLIAFYLFGQFLDGLRIYFFCFVDQLFAGLGVALYELVQTFFGNVLRALSLVLHRLFSWVKSLLPFG